MNRKFVFSLLFLCGLFSSSCGTGIGSSENSFSAYSGEILSHKGLVFYAPMDEKSGDLSDYFGRFSGKAVGNLRYGQTGGLNLFDSGRNRSIQFSSSECFEFSTNNAFKLAAPFTLTFMVYLNSAPAPHFPVMSAWDGSGKREWRVRVDSSYAIGLETSLDGTASNFSYLAPSIASSSWYHVVVVVNEISEIRIYVNGSQWYYSASFVNPYSSSNVKFKIGCDETHGMIGLIDEVAIYRSSFSAADVSSLYNARSK